MLFYPGFPWLALVLLVGGWIALLGLRHRQADRHTPAHRGVVVWGVVAAGSVLQLLGWAVWVFTP